MTMEEMNVLGNVVAIVSLGIVTACLGWVFWGMKDLGDGDLS